MGCINIGKSVFLTSFFRMPMSASMLGYIWNVDMSVFGLRTCRYMYELGHN